jgi:DNA-binding MarR family transcriptional regulator
MHDSSGTFADQVFYRLLRLQRYLRQHARQMDKQGITPRHFAVLRFLLESEPATVGDVQAYLYRSASTTSTVIAQLEEAGYVTRTRSKRDNRVVMVELTPAGRDVAQNTPLAGLPLLRRRLRTLPQEQLQPIEDALTKIMELMEVPDGE